MDDKDKVLSLNKERTAAILEGAASIIAERAYSMAVARIEGEKKCPDNDFVKKNPLRYIISEALSDITTYMMMTAEAVTAIEDEEYSNAGLTKVGEGTLVDGVRHWDERCGYPVLGILELTMGGAREATEQFLAKLRDYLMDDNCRAIIKEVGDLKNQAPPPAEDQAEKEDQAAKEERIIEATRAAQRDIWG